MYGNDDVQRDLDGIFGENNGNLPPQLAGALATILVSAGPMGTPLMTGDELEYHDSSKIVLPKGMAFQRAMQILQRMHDEAETITEWTRDFDYRIDDGAVATFNVLKKHFGMVAGETIETFFGTRRPEQRTVTIGYNQKVQVPWGRISVPTLDGVEMDLCGTDYHRDGVGLFHLHVTAPKKYKSMLEEIFNDIDEELKTNSIYRGKALAGSEKLEFLDVDSFNADEIVFSQSVTDALEAAIWAPLRYTEAFREEGLRTKRATLLYGPFGTGKSSAGLITAQIATANGWTFLSAKPGEDDIDEVLENARLYQPAVVFIEDFDNQGSTSDDDKVSELLEALDGITAKGSELVLVLTTNHRDRIHKGMFRPGRLDAIIEINELDRDSVERLIKIVVPAGKLAEDVDFDEVYTAMEGFYPAFVREAVERSKSYAVARGKGMRNYTLSTTDLVKAAESLKPQLKVLNEANEGETKPDLEVALGAAITAAGKEAVHGTVLKVRGHEHVLSVPGMNGLGH